ncbi:hypothetical protein [Gemmatimonas sp.]|uniref:hypothetical protein n=1 Tax=Gemmatimonas sp. TaxID=1962908 RepID=UPI0025BFCAAF|nr:hypothetical protein [Gemmatimonas sp.]MCA2993189.1 hypothetical protein [Gemmatimonas sp.]
MGLQIRLARPDDAEAIARLNARLRAGGVDTPVYPPDVVPAAQPDEPQESYYVVADGDEIRGSVYLRRSRLWLAERSIPVGWIKYPVAESLVERRFAGVPAAMIMHLQRELPTLLAVGMGGLQGQFAKLLQALRWSGAVVPTYVLPVDPLPVLTELPQLASRPRVRRAASVLRLCGAAPVTRGALRAWNAIRGIGTLRDIRVSPYAAPDAGWNALFRQIRGSYRAMADRGQRAVTWAIPPAAPGVGFWTVERQGQRLGWFAAQQFDFRRARHRPYGALRVGMLHDMLADPANAGAVVTAAVRTLVKGGAQLLVGNHSAPEWRPAFRAAGFLEAPPSFACLASPALVRVLAEAGLTPAQLYVTRGDDGVMNPEVVE